jgi:hypothetical protein
VLKVLGTWENSAQRLLTELGLVATSRAELIENLASANRQLFPADEVQAVLDVYQRAMIDAHLHGLRPVAPSRSESAGVDIT